ncbi:hypothetical protein J3R83DRAFT_12013 [Lanmaoa asiatica]|nr:hypothetical protein J3R83DRAFT_12013 [Lanmaoa asiatica]
MQTSPAYSLTGSSPSESETHSNPSEWAVPSPLPSSAVDQAASAKDEKTEVSGHVIEPCSMWTNIQQVDLVLEKIYANMSACHLKQENWKRAIDTADKVITTTIRTLRI